MKSAWGRLARCPQVASSGLKSPPGQSRAGLCVSSQSRTGLCVSSQSRTGLCVRSQAFLGCLRVRKVLNPV